MKRQYRMPGGKVTESRDEYIESWDTLAKKVLKFFPGYTMDSYDPVMTFTMWEELQNGKCRAVDSFVLSVIAANVLIGTTNEK